MDSRDLSTLYYFLDVLRKSPEDAARLSKVVLEEDPSEELKKAVSTIVSVVEQAVPPGSTTTTHSVKAVHGVLQDRVQRASESADEVAREALGALKLAFRVG